MAPELFCRKSEEGQLKIPLMRKEVDIYALGMLIYEVRFLIEGSHGRTLNTILGPVGKETVPQGAPRDSQPKGFPWGTAATTINNADPGSYLGNIAGMLERGAHTEADGWARHDRVHSLCVAERATGVASNRFSQPSQGYTPFPSHGGMNFSAAPFAVPHHSNDPIKDQF